jgi:hypothetical protein
VTERQAIMPKALMQKSLAWMGAAFGIALAVAALMLVLYGTDTKGIRFALEWTARWSFLLFWLAYAGNAVAVLFAAGALAGRGRELGLAFAAAHLVHIGLVVWLWRIVARPVLPPGLLWFFALGLFWTYLLAGLSFGGARALRPAAWRWIRLLGMNYILIAFGRDFLVPVIHPLPSQYNLGHFLFYVPFLLASIAAPLLVGAAQARRSARATVAGRTAAPASSPR